MPSDVSLTIAEREAELAALQSAFDEYITSSRELEEELDAELSKMQEKLAQSSSANSALSAQLENIAPQLTSLENAHADVRAKLQMEQKLRRQAEMGQDEAEAKCRELEGSLLALREDCDAAHEELAFKDSELEETRLELEVEKERHREEMQELRSDLSVQRSQNDTERDGEVAMNGTSRALPEDMDEEPSLEDEIYSEDKDYVKRLEDELELVTEQLIYTEQKLTRTEDLLAEEKHRSSSLEASSEKAQVQMDESILLELKEECHALKENEHKLKEEMELLHEELALTQEELRAAEQDAKHFVSKTDEVRSVHRDEMNSIKKELEKAVTDAKTYSAELETLEKTLQATSAETVALREENENLNIALENVKRDHDALVQELEDVNARFDEVREEAERSGYATAAEEIRAETIAAHDKELAELVEQMKDLAMANAGLQRMVDKVETALAAERDRQVEHVANSMPREVEEKLKNQLARTMEELENRTQELESLKSAFEDRVTKAEEDVSRLEKELSTTRGKLAEAEANLIVIRREKERDAATVPQQKRKGKARSPVATSRKVARSFSNVTEESRDDVGPLSSFGEPRSLSRRLQSSTRKKRSRSTSPTTPQRLEYRMSEEANKSKTLQEQYESLKDQNRMNEAHVKRLEEDLKVLQLQLFSNGGDTAVATQMSRISKLASPRKGGDDCGDVRDVGTDFVEDVIKSGDTIRITEELRKLDKKSARQREHNAQLLSKILNLQGNIQVCCRVRPLRMSELQQGNKSVVEAFSESEIGCFDARSNKWKSFGFDRVWGPDQSQQDVFQDVEPLALSVVDGYNACIFAYGQTGSGKTFTMEGTPEGNTYGISYRVIQKIFHLLNFRQQQQRAVSALRGESEKSLPFSFSLQIGMLEIYNDEVFDLLSPAAQGSATAADKKREARLNGEKATLDIRRSADGHIEVPGLTKEHVKSIQDVMDLLKRGNSSRATASTSLNEHSSRSHMVLLVDVKSGLEGQPSNNGCLYLVDLAGSERVRRSQVEGDQLKEAGFINKSLSALGNVMEALDRKASHVPYRDSKLTYLLQDSLGGNSRTMMVVAVCPMDSAYDESVHALSFATRVRRIQLGAAQRNVTSKNLEETVKALTSEMKMLTKAKEKSEHQLHSLKRDNTRIQERLQTISQSRVQQQSDSRTLEVLRKNNQEMVNRWQKEKSLREASTEELEQCQQEIQRIQKQLAAASRERDSLKRRFDEKEVELKDSTRELRRAKDASSAASLRARTAQVMNNRKGAFKNGSPGMPPRLPARPPMNAKPNITKTAETASPPAANPEEVREKVLALLEKYDKAKVDRIDIIMEKFKGKESMLLEKMRQRYEQPGSVSASLQVRSEQALARHKERMQQRKESQ